MAHLLRIIWLLVALSLASAAPAWALSARMPGAVIKSVQSISQSISHTAGTFVDNTTITAIDTTRTLLFVKSTRSPNGSPPGSCTGAYIASSTAVAWNTIVFSTGTLSRAYNADVVEFSIPFKSIQWVAGGATSRTINAVNVAKTAILSCNPETYFDLATSATLTNSTTVATTSNSFAVVNWWCVIEFY